MRRESRDREATSSLTARARVSALEQRAAARDGDGTVWVAMFDPRFADRWRGRQRPRSWDAALPAGCFGGLASVGALEWRAVQHAIEDAYTEAMLAETVADVRAGALSWHGATDQSVASARGVNAEAIVRDVRLVDIAMVDAPGAERVVLAVVCRASAEAPPTNAGRFARELDVSRRPSCTLFATGPTFFDEPGDAIQGAAEDAAALSNEAVVVYTRVSRGGRRSVAVRGLVSDPDRTSRAAPSVEVGATVTDARGRGPLEMRGVTYGVACAN
jgi:hypothetical protein